MHKLTLHSPWEHLKRAALDAKGLFTMYKEIRKLGNRVSDLSLLCYILRESVHLPITHGQRIHAYFIKQGFYSFTSIGNSTLSFYMKHQRVDCALDFLSEFEGRDSVSFNIMIHGYLMLGDLREGFRWFLDARRASFEPITATLVLLIRACTTFVGFQVHGYIIRSGLGSVAVHSSLLSLYAEIDTLLARALFDEMPEKDVISYSVVISGYANGKEPRLALTLFRQMISEAVVQPDELTAVSVIKASTNLGYKVIGEMLHAVVVRNAFDLDVFVCNSLVHMYSKFCDVESAVKVFNAIPQPNIVSWNTMLSGFSYNHMFLDVVKLFSSMRNAEVESDEVTAINLLQACKHLAVSSFSKILHCWILPRGYHNNDLVMNALMDAYARCNLPHLSMKVFHGMERKDVVSWSTLIAGLAYCGKAHEAIDVFFDMICEEVKPNVVTMLNLLEACLVSAELITSKWGHGIAVRRGFATDVTVGTAILDMYSKCGAVDESRRVFDQISLRNLACWSAIIGAYGRNGLVDDALSLLSLMKQQGLKPNAVTALSVLAACSHAGQVERGLRVFEEMVREDGVEIEAEHCSSMVDMLGRAGELDSAVELIKRMPEEIEGRASLWSALLSACRSSGNNKLGALAFLRLRELEPSGSMGIVLASGMYAAGGEWAEALRVRWLVDEIGVRPVSAYSCVRVSNEMV